VNKATVNLAVPTLSIDTNAKTANWNAVANATNGYTIQIDTNEHTVASGTSYDLSSLGVGDHSISVKANGLNNTTHIYNASAYCAAVTYTVSAPSSSAKAITAFSFASPQANGIIDETAKTIRIYVPSGTDVISLTPTVTHTGASYSPTGAQDFTNGIIYTVTAQDGSQQEYIVYLFGIGSGELMYGYSYTNDPDNNETFDLVNFIGGIATMDQNDKMITFSGGAGYSYAIIAVASSLGGLSSIRDGINNQLLGVTYFQGPLFNYNGIEYIPYYEEKSPNVGYGGVNNTVKLFANTTTSGIIYYGYLFAQMSAGDEMITASIADGRFKSLFIEKANRSLFFTDEIGPRYIWIPTSLGQLSSITDALNTPQNPETGTIQYNGIDYYTYHIGTAESADNNLEIKILW